MNCNIGITFIPRGKGHGHIQLMSFANSTRQEQKQNLPEQISEKKITNTEIIVMLTETEIVYSIA